MKLSTRMVLAMVSLVLMTAGVIGVLAYRNIEALVLPRALGGIEARARLLALELEASVRGARGDALGFRSAVAVEGMMQASAAGGADSSGMTGAQWRERLANRFVAELQAKSNYSEFRIIGASADGREILRVDRLGPDGSIRIVPENELQSKGERDFLKHALELPPGSVEVSDVELKQDYGRIVLPHVPTIRASAPIHGPDGRPFGAIVINVDLRSVFDRIRARSGPGMVYLVNEQGDFLIHPDRSREFGFEFAKPDRLQHDFPALASALSADPDQPRIVRDRDGQEYGVAPISVRLAQGPVVTLVLAWPYSVVIAPAISVRNSVLLAAGLAVLLAFVLAILLARSLTRPLAAMTDAVEAFGRGEPMAAPVDAHGETGVLARAFTRMASEVEAKSAEVRRNAETFDSIMTSMADALLVVDGEGKTLLANAASKAMFGDREDIGSEDWQKVYHRFRSDETTPLLPDETPIGRAMRGESFDGMTLAMRHEGETKFTHIVASGRPVRDPNGAQQGAVIVYRDVTETRQMERQLRQSQKLDAIGQLTGGVAHDFNNILTVITGTIEILTDGVGDRPQLATIARMIDEAATRGAELTQQLLAFARRQPLQPRAIDPNALVIETAKLLRPTLGEHIEVEAMLEENAWRAVADPGQLTTALLNLAVNARDAMPGGGKLTLETDNVILDEAYAQSHADVRPGAYTMIAVSDTGSGIPAALLDKVFEPFFTTKEVGKGTGLGLSMVYGFVKQSGGHIQVYSEEGQGTSIKLYLPRAEAAGEAAADPVRAAPTLPRGNEMILVVEDDALVRDYVVAQLKSLGYATHAAANAAEALEFVKSGASFDLLFTDVIMPGGMNGRQLAEEVARLRPGTRVLYTSGYTENAIIHQGRLDPGVALLNKPYRKKDLAEKLRQVIDAPPARAA